MYTVNKTETHSVVLNYSNVVESTTRVRCILTEEGGHQPPPQTIEQIIATRTASIHSSVADTHQGLAEASEWGTI